MPARRWRHDGSSVRRRNIRHADLYDHLDQPRRAKGPSRPEAAILVILENTSGTGWLLLTIAHVRNDVPLRLGSGVMSLGVSSGDMIGYWSLSLLEIEFVTGIAAKY